LKKLASEKHSSLLFRSFRDEEKKRFIKLTAGKEIKSNKGKSSRKQIPFLQPS
jgi:hypothetical protein